MILLALLMAAEPQAHPRGHPKATLEWLDHYDYCLDVNFAQVLNAKPEGGVREAAKRAVVRCWPVYATAKGKLLDDLDQEGGGSDANERHEIVHRLLNLIATAFAARIGVNVEALGPLTPPH